MLKQRQGGSYKYLKIKDGKIKCNGDDTLYDEVTGLVTDIAVEDAAFEGRPYEQLVISMTSEGEAYKLQMNFDSSIAQSFLSFIKNADLSKEVTIVPIIKTEMKNGAEVTKRSVLIKQGSEWLKSYFTKDHPNGLPPMKQVTVSGKVMFDRTDMLQHYKQVINNELKPQLVGNDSVVTTKPEVETEEDSLDLPF